MTEGIDAGYNAINNFLSAKEFLAAGCMQSLDPDEIVGPRTEWQLDESPHR